MWDTDFAVVAALRLRAGTGHFHVSRRLGRRDSTKRDDFWEASPDARQRR